MHILALHVDAQMAAAAVLDADTKQPVSEVGRVALTPSSPVGDEHEVEAETLWQAVARAARTATRYSADVHGVGLSVKSPALVLINAHDQPLQSIWTPLDRRSRRSARQVWAGVGDEFLQTTGARPLPGGMSVIGFRQRLIDDPYLTHDVARYLHLNSWLCLRMTGETAFDPGNASATGLYNTMTDQEWSPRWCEFFEVDLDWLPPVVPGDLTIGSLRSKAATELGVPAGIPVKLGCDDISCLALAADLKPGELLHIAGATDILAVIAEKPKPDSHLLIRRMGVGDGYMQIACNPVGTHALDWIHTLCFREQSEEQFFSSTIAEAAQRTTRVQLEPPHLGGDEMEIEAHRAAFRELHLGSDRMDLLSALLNAMKRCHRRAVEALGQMDSFGSIVLTGHRTDVVRKMISDYGDINIQDNGKLPLVGVTRLFA